jgi:hypothetical protein
MSLFVVFHRGGVALRGEGGTRREGIRDAETQNAGVVVVAVHPVKNKTKNSFFHRCNCVCVYAGVFSLSKSSCFLKEKKICHHLSNGFQGKKKTVPAQSKYYRD